ncbi:hypothetical protein T190_17050 [Sinorhizobium meliloti CCBAU 01290]|nr:hypothetical protein T190_17050 [Sinorhizobium meliloti CCBAU 01290]
MTDLDTATGCSGVRRAVVFLSGAIDRAAHFTKDVQAVNDHPTVNTTVVLNPIVQAVSGAVEIKITYVNGAVFAILDESSPETNSARPIVIYHHSVYVDRDIVALPQS